jgi:murein DD-endopeptidase MepM/ murein hydrolase activator NlpD
MKSTVTLCAVAVIFVGVSLPAAAIPYETPAPTTAALGSERITVTPQTFAVASASSVAATPVVRDAFGVEQLVIEPVVSASSYGGGYAGQFAGFLSVWPAAGGVNDGFGYRDGGEFHGGIDIMAGYGSAIVSAAPGVVISVASDGGWGQYVKVDHGSGVQTLYAHMIYGSPTVSAGQYVDAGTMLGSVGDTGYASVAHLHFETYVDGVRVDPFGLLP